MSDEIRCQRCHLHDVGAAADDEAAVRDLRDALRHYDEQLSAREWRDAYFVLARIAIKQLAIGP